jgi:thiol-disulfide isomerase/thioredoxin
MKPFALLTVLMAAAVLCHAAPSGPANIGDRVTLPPLKDLHYNTRSFADPGEHAYYVLYFFANTCPVAQRYMGAMNEIARDYAPRGVQFVAINVSPADSILDTAQTVLEYGVSFTVLKDMTGDSARALGITRTPEIALLDKDGTLLYRGRVNDQFRLGGVRPKPTREDLREALNEVLEGKPVSVTTTKAEGCAITYPPLPKPQDPVTFSEHIAPVISKCTGCHAPGGPAPFALTSLEDVQPRAQRIVEAVTEGKMPPWFAASDHGHFANDTRLSEREKLLLQQWLAGGLLPGDGGEISTAHAIAPASLLEAPADAAAVTLESSGSPVSQTLSEAIAVSAIQIRGEGFRACTLTATSPGGNEETLLSLPAFNPEWPIVYQLQEPLRLSPGTIIILTSYPAGGEGSARAILFSAQD